MESLNDQIWTDEDDDVVNATRDILIILTCLVSCEGGSTGSCGGGGTGGGGPTMGSALVRGFCGTVC